MKINLTKISDAITNRRAKAFIAFAKMGDGGTRHRSYMKLIKRMKKLSIIGKDYQS